MSGPGDKLKDGPLYDDLGNLIQAPGGAPFINEQGNIEVRKVFHQDRVVERNAGCWNCRHFDTGAVFDKRVQDAYVRRFSVYKQVGAPDEIARKGTEQDLKPLQAPRGFIGICVAGKNGDDFVTMRFLCTHWSGKQGASLARAPGEALSPLVGEVLDKLGEKPSLGHASKPDDADGE